MRENEYQNQKQIHSRMRCVEDWLNKQKKHHKPQTETIELKQRAKGWKDFNWDPMGWTNNSDLILLLELTRNYYATIIDLRKYIRGPMFNTSIDQLLNWWCDTWCSCIPTEIDRWRKINAKEIVGSENRSPSVDTRRIPKVFKRRGIEQTRSNRWKWKAKFGTFGITSSRSDATTARTFKNQLKKILCICIFWPFTQMEWNLKLNRNFRCRSSRRITNWWDNGGGGGGTLLPNTDEHIIHSS